jgi:osmotically-inducible protein OsmY
MSIRKAAMWVGISAVLLLRPAVSVLAQHNNRSQPSPQETLLKALAANPVTAPYRFTARVDRGRVVLSGRVGTKAIHDVAVQVAIATGIPFQDRLVIDTAEVTRPPAPATGSLPGPPVVAPRAVPLSGTVTPYVYPEPLFGYVDEPFYGFEPPLIAYPPWWQPRSQDVPEVVTPPARPQGAATDVPEGSVELTIDPLGFGVLRGTVATQEEKEGIAEKAARLQGIRGIINRIQVNPERVPDGRAPETLPPEPPAPEDDPPPPPEPYQEAPREATRSVAAEGLAARVRAALRSDPLLATAAVQVSVLGGTATLSGRVPSALEALHAFRAAQTTPGVERIVDRLLFPLPADGEENPLVEHAKAEDLEPYLEFQLHRHLAGRAQVDRVKVEGREVTILGTVPSGDEIPRVSSILQTLPLLRGFRVQTNLVSR